nr:ARID DNA-binding domain-containing protein [Tanacetum cinerariifolium]
MVNTNSFLEAKWSSPNSGLGYSHSWYQSKFGKPVRKRLQQYFIQRKMKREKEARLGSCIKQITNDCKDILRKKLEEIELYNSTIPQNKYRRHKCFKCKQRDKLDDQRKFLFTYGMGEVVIKNDGQGYLITGVHYAPEVTLNILSIDLLEKKGFKILYENDRYKLEYMFRNQKGQNLDEDNLRQMQNNFLEKYFEFLDNKDTCMEEDLIRIKGNIYSTKVQTFNAYVAFLNLIKQDEILSQEWDIFRNKFDKVVKRFYNYYLEKSLPGPIPPTINGVQIHLFDLYKLVEGLEGYLSVYFGHKFGTIGEILGLSKGNRENIKKCSIKYLDVFTSYYKTARVPQQEYESILKKPTRKVEEDKDKKCLMSHQ